MNTASLLCSLGLTVLGANGALAEPPAARMPQLKEQIAGALLAAPEGRRTRATVLAYWTDGSLFVARGGTNDLVCLADNPQKPGFQAACYHRDLEPYMARGRALRASGIVGEENRKTRWREIDQGALAMPRQPRILYVLHGQGYEPEAGGVIEPYLRWVIYTPYATPASSGLSLSPRPGAPWLMYPGTAGAHIMINPPKPKPSGRK